MQRKVISFREDTPVDEIAGTLAEKHITGAPVLSDDGHVAGIVSEVDVFTKKGRTAAEIMSSHVISITEDTPIDEAARLLAGQRIRRLPVMAKGKMVGLLSRSDVLEFFAQTHWTCTVCGNMERGLEQPESCPQCGNKEFHLDRAHPGH
jgi:CBS domain-containing protein